MRAGVVGVEGQQESTNEKSWSKSSLASELPHAFFSVSHFLRRWARRSCAENKVELYGLTSAAVP